MSMNSDIYNKVDSFLNRQPEPIDRDRALACLNAYRINEVRTMESRDRVNSLLSTSLERTISENTDNNYTSELMAYVTRCNYSMRRNEILQQISGIQLGKIDILTKYYNGEQTEETAHFFSELMKQHLKEEAKTRTQMLIEDNRAKKYIPKITQTNNTISALAEEIVTKNDEILLTKDIEEHIEDIPQHLLLDPDILKHYASDLIIVCKHRADKAKDIAQNASFK